MTLIRKKDRRDPTPEEMAKAEEEFREEEKKWQEYLKNKGKKPDWLPDENSTYKEVLEFKAYIQPFKLQQMIDVCESEANSLSDFAYNVYDDNPKERERWLNMAEDMRKQAEDMRSKKWMYRLVAEEAMKELDELQGSLQS